jgi:hypothetical protein
MTASRDRVNEVCANGGVVGGQPASKLTGARESGAKVLTPEPMVRA